MPTRRQNIKLERVGQGLRCGVKALVGSPCFEAELVINSEKWGLVRE
jgi:hypothetical protein